MIVLNDFKRQWADVGSDCLTAVERVGASGWYVLGKEVELFENALAEQSGMLHAVGCGNGLDAIEISLRALGLQPGGKVLTTPLSAFATTLGIVRAGGIPVFVDVDRTGSLDLDLAEQAIERHPEIRFMVPVHLFGHPLNLNRLQSLRNRHGVTVVEDAAQSIQALHGGQVVGSAGHATTLSFYPTKNLGAMGDAGALLTDDEGLADKFRNLRDYGQSSKYVHSKLGMNSRLDELHAAVLRTAMLPRLSGWTNRRRVIGERYVRGIDHQNVQVVSPSESSISSWHLFPLLVEPGQREAFMAHLDTHQIQSGIHYPRLIPDQEALRNVPGVQILGSLGVAKQFAAGEVTLPVHPFLSDDEVEKVIHAVNSWECK